MVGLGLDLGQVVAGLVCGAGVGLVLGTIGGGGSILAVPLMMYAVGGVAPHVAIGTSAVAVALNAAGNLWTHARRGNVRWPCALTFGSAGVLGALLGSALGKQVDGQRLLALFALLMVIVAIRMVRTRDQSGDPEVRLNRQNLPWLLGLGLATGMLSGFFGIGGGFLIVPALMTATGMPILTAVGSSLVAVALFGLATSASYAWSGLVNWALAGVFVGGGVAGGLIGARLGSRLAEARGLLNLLFAALLVLVACYMLYRTRLA